MLLVFLLFYLEITLVFPYAVSKNLNDIYGLIIVLIFLVIVTIGFSLFTSLERGPPEIDSKQNLTNVSGDYRSKVSIAFLGNT